VAVCPSCGTDNPDIAKFCMVCATPLDQQTEPSVEERKVVSVLFVDLVGFTARSHDADPEDVRAALAPYHRLLKTEIERFGGTVEKFIGDAVMAVFGAPVAHEDDAERGVRAALRITEAIAELNEATPNLDLSIRAAVNTGEGLVTLGARPQAGEGMVTGDVVNTASRLQGIAPVGGVAVGEVTYRTTKDFISYEPLDPVTVKGKPEPVPVWRAVSARSRFGVDVDMAPKTPFIGRDFDFATLKTTYQRTIREASVQLVTITGEPGVGKTRLLAEFSSFIDAQEEIVYWRQGRSLPYGEGITFWALGEIIKAQAGILESDSPETALDKVQGSVDAVVDETDERAWFVARLGPLVGAKASQSGGGVEKEESFTAWRRFLEAIASRSPLVLVFEDLHWADAAMLEFIDHLVEWSTGVPMLVACTARPELYETHQGWGGGKRNSNTVSLSPLSDSETAQLISGLLSQAVLPAEVHSALLERAGGNPLYAEEFIRMLSDRGILQRKGRVLTIDPDADITMPDNVQALIAARLDTLPLERKALLHDASVAGKVFWSGAVAALGKRDDQEVREGLHELARKELVRPARTSSMKGQQEYSFWHGLVRDVAYGQIPRAMRSRKHRGMAEWIEGIAGDRVSDHADLLAHHYREAFELAQASGDTAQLPVLRRRVQRFLLLAADRALALDVAKARAYYQEALDSLSPDDPARGQVLYKLGKASHHSGELAHGEALYQEAVAVLVANGDVRSAAEALGGLGEVAWRLGRGWEAVFAPLERALQLLSDDEPCSELARIYAELAIHTYLVKSLYDESLHYAAQALSLAHRLNDTAVEVVALGYRAAARVGLGDTHGIDDLRESIRIGLDAGLSAETATSYTNLAEALAVHEGPKAAFVVADEALQFCRSRGLMDQEMWARASTADLLFELGRWSEARARADEVMAWSQQHDAVQTTAWALEVQSSISLHSGDMAEADTQSAMLLSLNRGIGDLQVLLPALLLRAMVAALTGRLDEARTLLLEFEQTSLRDSNLRRQFVLDAVYVAARCGDIDVMEKLLSDASPSGLRTESAISSAKAILAEAKRDWRYAASLFIDAAQRWRDYESPLEEGRALFGLARCLIALGDREAATEPLHKARAIFERLNAVPLHSEVDGFLGDFQAASS
jgi:class 3 adenylate cyclase/tetratricopeptide (TPR) repeat protein